MKPQLKVKSQQGQSETDDSPLALGTPLWDWSRVRRVLIIRLRSIGDTVLSTPAIYTLRRFLPNAEIDLLLEDWVAPLVSNSSDITRVITIKRGSIGSRLSVLTNLRRSKYDVAFNLHGGTTATLLTFLSGSRYTVGYKTYQYSSLYTHTAPHPSELWNSKFTHSAEQQLGLIGWTGVPVTDRPKSRLKIDPLSEREIQRRLEDINGFALIHPAAAFESKQWPAERFASVIDYLKTKGIEPVVVATKNEAGVIEACRQSATSEFHSWSDLTIPEVVALASKARIFIGNDSGIAHISNAVGTPSVVIFGSSNINHWGPWRADQSIALRHHMPCAPCAGFHCSQFERPECIRMVGVEDVISTIKKLLGSKDGNTY
jgi:ADP-heptose:LPS heptosyltransferase